MDAEVCAGAASEIDAEVGAEATSEIDADAMPKRSRASATIFTIFLVPPLGLK